MRPAGFTFGGGSETAFGGGAGRRVPALLAALVLLLATCGCVSVGPDFAPPDPFLPQASFFGRPAPAETEASLPPGGPTRSNSAQVDPQWWAAFRDPILTSLAARAAGANLDVRAASARLAESRFQRGVAASAAFPSVNGDASYQRELYSQNGILSLAKGSNGQPIQVPPISVYQTGFDASWEIDIWGHVRRQIEAAEAEVESSEYQRRDALVATLAEVARDYIELRGVQTQIAIANANLASANDILQLTRTRAERGLTTGLDVENAAAQAESVRAQLPSLENQQSGYLNALSLLLDEPPGSLQSALARAKPIPPTPPRAPLGVPSELARRRPDIRRAEAELHAATANIGVAVADFYPSVKFNGTVGFNALDLKNLGREARCNISSARAFRFRSSTAPGSNRPWTCATRSSRKPIFPITRPCFRLGTRSSTPWSPIGPSRSAARASRRRSTIRARRWGFRVRATPMASGTSSPFSTPSAPCCRPSCNMRKARPPYRPISCSFTRPWAAAGS